MKKFTDLIKKYNNLDDIFSDDLKITLNILYKIINENNIKVFLTGGIVRDIFIKQDTKDIDFTLESNSEALLNLILSNFEVSNYKFSERFFTYNISLKNGINIDIALFREENYKYSGALPDVFLSTMNKDYLRRDFTINSMYISFDKKLELYDFLNGTEDIKNKIIKILHDKSFEDDPTRILRAIKFAARYNFSFDENTKILIKKAVNKKYLSLISSERLKNELYLLFSEKNIFNILSILKKYNIFESLGIKNISNKNIELISKILISDFYIKCQNIFNIQKERFIFVIIVNENNLYQENKDFLIKLGFSEKIIKSIIFDISEKENIIEILKNTNKSSQLYNILKNLTLLKILYLYFTNKNLQSRLEFYLFELNNKDAIISGRDLILAGFENKVLYSSYLKRCFEIQLDMEKPTKEKIIKIFKEELDKNGNL